MLLHLVRDRGRANDSGRNCFPVRVQTAMAVFVKHAKALLLATTILIVIGSVPVLIGMAGRSLAPDRAAPAFEAQLDRRPVLQW
jgi:hypothetical protein